MTRRLLAAAALAVALTPVAATATAFSFRNPLDGCTYTVWAPSLHSTGSVAPPWVATSGGFGEDRTCP